MKFQEIKAPYFEKKDIYKQADAFRKKYWTDEIPVDVEKICEFALGIQVIPFDNLRVNHDTEALICHSFKHIFIDSKLYMDDRQLNRLRFSIAHEIGHLVLHKDILKKYNLETIDDYIRWFSALSEKQYSLFEMHANEFAGRLLVPHNKFIEFYNSLKQNGNWLVQAQNNFSLARTFGVSQEVIERRILHDENIKTFLGSLNI